MLHKRIVISFRIIFFSKKKAHTNCGDCVNCIDCLVKVIAVGRFDLRSTVNYFVLDNTFKKMGPPHKLIYYLQVYYLLTTFIPPGRRIIVLTTRA